jgi:hypothetical protein
MAEDTMFDAFVGDDHNGDTLAACRVPLDRVRIAVKGKACAKYFDVADMMYMFSVRVDGVALHHYKHRDTRRYLIVDDNGSPHLWIPPIRDDDFDAEGDEATHSELDDMGTFQDLPSVGEALDGLYLFELPWLKPELEADRRGLTWDERSEHPVAKAWYRRRMKAMRRRWTDLPGSGAA